MTLLGSVPCKPLAHCQHHLDAALLKPFSGMQHAMAALIDCKLLFGRDPIARITWMPLSGSFLECHDKVHPSHAAIRKGPFSPHPLDASLRKCSSEAHHLDAVLWKVFLEAVRGNVESFHGPHHMDAALQN
eukprot:234138-Amphidinium_carterae.1